MTRPTLALLCLIPLLHACGQSDSQPAPKLYQEQRNALDKAKAVDPMVQKLDEEQRKALEQQSK